MDEFLQAHLEIGRKGSVRSWYDRAAAELTPEQLEALDAALACPDIGQRAIVVVMKRWGYVITVGQVGWHRRAHGL